MSEDSIKAKLTAAMKAAMKAKEKERLSTIRMAQAAIKQVQIDEGIELDDARTLAILDKMVKQRRESIKQFEDAGRTELAEKESFEIGVLQEFLPQQLSTEEIEKLIKEAIASTGAESMRDMGKVMGVLKPQVQGRADMSEVSKQIKALLG